ARPDTLLEPETRYGLVVTRALRDARGRPIRPSAAFQRALRGAGPAALGRAYRQALRALSGALGRRGVRPEDVAVASVFTTGSLSAFLEQARDALDRRPPPPALVTAPEGGGRAWFPRAELGGLALRLQVRAAGEPEAFVDRPLPATLLPPDVGGLAVAWFWSPAYLAHDRRIPDRATARPLGEPPATVPLPFVVVLPRGAPPS